MSVPDMNMPKYEQYIKRLSKPAVVKEAVHSRYRHFMAVTRANDAEEKLRRMTETMATYRQIIDGQQKLIALLNRELMDEIAS